MSTEAPLLIEHSNLSAAWSFALLETMKAGRRKSRPIVLTIGGFDTAQPPEIEALRKALDQNLLALDKNLSDISAMTIFPYKIWCRRGRPSCEEFSELCIKRLFPRMRRLDRRNRYGTYFQRLMASSGTRGSDIRVVNQLQTVIDLLNGDRRPRESALQMSCFDPSKDHTGQPVRGFPCLQQVSISYDDDGNLALSAFYPVQYIFDRAYGNYLGLCHLGEFIAHESHLKFSRLTCYIGRPELGDVNKRDVQDLADLAVVLIQA